jgi:hypothetical protein
MDALPTVRTWESSPKGELLRGLNGVSVEMGKGGVT